MRVGSRGPELCAPRAPVRTLSLPYAASDKVICPKACPKANKSRSNGESWQELQEEPQSDASLAVVPVLEADN